MKHKELSSYDDFLSLANLNFLILVKNSKSLELKLITADIYNNLNSVSVVFNTNNKLCTVIYNNLVVSTDCMKIQMDYSELNDETSAEIAFYRNEQHIFRFMISANNLKECIMSITHDLPRSGLVRAI